MIGIFHLLWCRSKDEWEPLTSLLSTAGADVVAQDNDGHTPLHLASILGQAEVAYILIEHSAGVPVQDKDANTLLHLALQGAHVYSERGSPKCRLYPAVASCDSRRALPQQKIEHQVTGTVP